MCALVGYIATVRSDLSATLVPSLAPPLTLPPSAGDPGPWASGDATSQSATFVASPASVVIPVVPTTSSDLGLTVFDPPSPLSTAESPPPHTPQPSSPESASSSSLSSSCADHNSKKSHQDIISRPTQDVLVINYDSDLSDPSPSSSPAPPTPKPNTKLQAVVSEGHGKGKSRETAEDVLYDLSLQLASSVSSISQAVDMDFIRALAQSFNREVAEILALLDQFVQEIRSHSASFLEDPKRVMKKLKKKLTRGNRQARKNAKMVVDIGERFFGMVKNNIEAVTSPARGTENGEVKKTGKSTRRARVKERALRMHRRVFKSEEWLKHERALAERRAGAVQPH